MTKIKAVSVVAAILMSLGILSSVYAAMDAFEKSTYKAGGVLIDVDIYSISDEGKEMKAKDSRFLSSLSDISYIPKIKNEGDDVYIRVKACMKSRDGEEETVNAYLKGYSRDWTEKGEYFYLKEVLEAGSDTAFCRELEISPEMEEALFFDIILKADCVQAKNFTPDFEDENPWGSLEIESSQIEEGFEVRKAEPAKREGLDICFEENAKEYVKNEDGFFAGFGKIMPGDTYTDALSFRSKGKVNILFKAEAGKSSLNSMLHLNIKAGGKTFYDGNMLASELKEYKRILALDGTSGDIIFTVSMPPGAKDEYQTAESNASWHFAAEEIETPKTGDEGALAAGIIMFISGFLLYYMARKKNESI